LQNAWRPNAVERRDEMIIVVPKEIKNGEEGVAVPPKVWMPWFLTPIVC